MFILRDLLRPLQAHFSDTTLGQERASLLAYTLLSIIVPFTSSMTSNCLRCLETLFGIDIKKKRFYTFMASSTLPWQKLWHTTWGLIPAPETDGRVLVALDDFINPKVGKNIFGCETIFDHAAKANQSQYPWAQNVVSVGLLKRIKGRWACLFLDFLYGKQRDVLAYTAIVMLRTLKCPVRVVWVFRKTQWVALFTTDLDLSVIQIIEYYGAHWKIEIDQPCCLHKRVFRKLVYRFHNRFDPGTFYSPQYA